MWLDELWDLMLKRTTLFLLLSLLYIKELNVSCGDSVSYSRKDFVHWPQRSWVFFSHALWHFLKSPPPPPQSILWGPRLTSLCQVVDTSSHLVTSQTGAGWLQCWTHYKERHRSPKQLLLCLCLCAWLCAMSQAISPTLLACCCPYFSQQTRLRDKGACASTM